MSGNFVNEHKLNPDSKNHLATLTNVMYQILRRYNVDLSIRNSRKILKTKTAYQQGCQMKSSINSQTELKRGQKKVKLIALRSEKKQTLFVALLFLCHKKIWITKISLEFFVEIWFKSCLALHWSSSLILLWIFMACVNAHFGYNGATVCVLIHR